MIIYLWTEHGGNTLPDCPNDGFPQITQWIARKEPNDVNWETNCGCTYPPISIWYGDFSPLGMYILFTKHFKVNFRLTQFIFCLFQAAWK